MSKIKTQSGFSRVKYNEAKMGAYYTDLDHCKWISHFLEFPEDSEVCCLEPSVGDAMSVLTVTGKDQEERENIKIFAVELNESTYKEVCEQERVYQCLKADFLNDVLISHHSFSFGFMNPPYGTQEDGGRYEVAFLRKVLPYLTKDAVMVVVVPISVAKSSEFLEIWSGEFVTEHLYRFHEKEFEKYKQVVLFGRKKEAAIEKSEKERMKALMADPGVMPLLPEDYDGKRMQIPKSSEKNIAEFMNRVFDDKEAGKTVEKSPLHGIVADRIFVPPYIIDNLGRPPIMPSEGHMYLLAVSGAGQGLVGSEENGDLHLQRGVTRMATRSEYALDENGVMKEVVISYPQVSFTLVESNGEISTLQ